MSFYFTIQTKSRPTPAAIVETTGRTDVHWLESDGGTIAFYVPGQSLRGAMVYPTQAGYTVGVNAFTTRVDAELAREVAAAIGVLTKTDVLPESETTAFPAADIREFGGPDWVNARYDEARSVLAMCREKPNETATIMGYRRAFVVNAAVLEAPLEEVLAEGAELQEIDQKEDIFAPRLMAVSKPASKPSFMARLRGAKTVEAQDITMFVLPEGVRSLTPEAMNGPLHVLLGTKENGFRLVPVERLHEVARQSGSREFGVGCFDISLSGSVYQDLWASGTPMG